MRAELSALSLSPTPPEDLCQAPGCELRLRGERERAPVQLLRSVILPCPLELAGPLQRPSREDPSGVEAPQMSGPRGPGRGALKALLGLQHRSMGLLEGQQLGAGGEGSTARPRFVLRRAEVPEALEDQQASVSPRAPEPEQLQATDQRLVRHADHASWMPYDLAAKAPLQVLTPASDSQSPGAAELLELRHREAADAL